MIFIKGLVNLTFWSEGLYL